MQHIINLFVLASDFGQWPCIAVLAILYARLAHRVTRLDGGVVKERRVEEPARPSVRAATGGRR